MEKNSNDFESLIKKDKYQVFVFANPAPIPINFARHPWFVLNKKGEISRWEVLHFKNKVDKNFKHVHLNRRAPFLGFDIIYPIEKYLWKPKLLGYLEGDEGSLAEKAVELIENSRKNYPYCDKYSFFGPNSNTYLQWVLNKFPELNIKLSWHFIGKGFKIKE